MPALAGLRMSGDLRRTIGSQRSLRQMGFRIHVSVLLPESCSQHSNTHLGRIFTNAADAGMTFSAVIYVAISVDLASRRMQTAMVVFEV